MLQLVIEQIIDEPFASYSYLQVVKRNTHISPKQSKYNIDYNIGSKRTCGKQYFIFIQENSARFNNVWRWHCVCLWCFVITDKNVKIVKTNMHCFKLYNLNTGNEFYIDT